MNYESESVNLKVDITGAANISANIIEAQPLEITLGKAAEINVGQAVTYIESGKQEVQEVVTAGITYIHAAIGNLAKTDLSNLTAIGEARFSAKQNVISDLTTIRSGAAAGASAVQPASLASYALDNTVVHLTGSETITGNKMFSGNITEKKSDPSFYLDNTNISKGTAPDATNFSYIKFRDVNGNEMGFLRMQYSTSKSSSITFRVYKANEESDTDTMEFSLTYPASGSPYIRAPLIVPSADNTVNLGNSSNRWKQLYAATTTIATSDERLKQGIENVPDEVLDAWGEVEFYRYKFNDAVQEKGVENARYHTGLIAQRIANIFASHDLNAFAYGLLCYDEWTAQEAEFDKDGNEIISALAAGNRYALRYEECLCLEAAYQRRRADRIEARLAALEARV